MGKQITVYNYFSLQSRNWLTRSKSEHCTCQSNIIVGLMTRLYELILKKYNSQACTNL